MKNDVYDNSELIKENDNILDKGKISINKGEISNKQLKNEEIIDINIKEEKMIKINNKKKNKRIPK